MGHPAECERKDEVEKGKIIETIVLWLSPHQAIDRSHKRLICAVLFMVHFLLLSRDEDIFRVIIPLPFLSPPMAHDRLRCRQINYGGLLGTRLRLIDKKLVCLGYSRPARYLVSRAASQTRGQPLMVLAGILKRAMNWLSSPNHSWFLSKRRVLHLFAVLP
ncbi:hypothetical protein F5883DRAFT_231908 [Diaporthe sp. PMI_573]|nr:hypothetical protein F5883DRAFT_231908 [Diaporthaceae sp. PMI_573]